jgi:hypothetical protein
MGGEDHGLIGPKDKLGEEITDGIALAEPVEARYFAFDATNQGTLLATVLLRCQKFNSRLDRHWAHI